MTNDTRTQVTDFWFLKNIQKSKVTKCFFFSQLCKSQSAPMVDLPLLSNWQGKWVFWGGPSKSLHVSVIVVQCCCA